MRPRIYILFVLFLALSLSCSAQQSFIDKYIGRWVSDGSITNKDMKVFTLAKEKEKPFIYVFNEYKFELRVDKTAPIASYTITGVGPGENTECNLKPYKKNESQDLIYGV